MARPKGKRDDILSSASDVFNTKGFHLANINDIAEHAGIGKGTVYEYFSSKNELFVEVVRYNTTAYIDHIRKATDNIEGFREKLTRLSQTHRHIVMENYEATGGFLSNPSAMAMAIENREPVMKILMETRFSIIGIISGILALGMAENLIQPMTEEKLRYASDLLFEMINRNTIRACQLKLDETHVLNEEALLIDIILNGIGA